jgi:hypothetical protein
MTLDEADDEKADDHTRPGMHSVNWVLYTPRMRMGFDPPQTFTT